MIKEGSLKAFKRYEAMLLALDMTPKCSDEYPMSGEHLLWMCQHCIERIEANDETFPVDKYSRWLGYIQGIMVSKNLITVQQERDITRPWFTKRVMPSIMVPPDFVGVSPMVGPSAAFIKSLKDNKDE